MPNQTAAFRGDVYWTSPEGVKYKAELQMRDWDSVAFSLIPGDYKILMHCTDAANNAQWNLVGALLLMEADRYNGFRRNRYQVVDINGNYAYRSSQSRRAYQSATGLLTENSRVLPLHSIMLFHRGMQRREREIARRTTLRRVNRRRSY